MTILLLQISTRTAIQIRSHAQKYLTKLAKQQQQAMGTSEVSQRQQLQLEKSLELCHRTSLNTNNIRCSSILDCCDSEASANEVAINLKSVCKKKMVDDTEDNIRLEIEIAPFSSRSKKEIKSISDQQQWLKSIMEATSYKFERMDGVLFCFTRTDSTDHSFFATIKGGFDPSEELSCPELLAWLNTNSLCNMAKGRIKVGLCASESVNRIIDSTTRIEVDVVKRNDLLIMIMNEIHYEVRTIIPTFDRMEIQDRKPFLKRDYPYLTQLIKNMIIPAVGTDFNRIILLIRKENKWALASENISLARFRDAGKSKAAKIRVYTVNLDQCRLMTCDASAKHARTVLANMVSGNEHGVKTSLGIGYHCTTHAKFFTDSFPTVLPYGRQLFGPYIYCVSNAQGFNEYCHRETFSQKLDIPSDLGEEHGTVDITGWIIKVRGHALLGRRRDQVFVRGSGGVMLGSATVSQVSSSCEFGIVTEVKMIEKKLISDTEVTLQSMKRLVIPFVRAQYPGDTFSATTGQNHMVKAVLKERITAFQLSKRVCMRAGYNYKSQVTGNGFPTKDKGVQHFRMFKIDKCTPLCVIPYQRVEVEINTQPDEWLKVFGINNKH